MILRTRTLNHYLSTEVFIFKKFSLHLVICNRTFIDFYRTFELIFCCIVKVSNMFWLQTVWLSVNFGLSVTLFGFIYRYLSKKPIVTVTLADHIYRDTIIYIDLLVLVASAGLIHCLFDDESVGEQTLNYDFSMLYSAFVMFFMGCLTM